MRCLAVLPNERSDKKTDRRQKSMVPSCCITVCKLQIRNTKVPFLGVFLSVFLLCCGARDSVCISKRSGMPLDCS